MKPITLSITAALILFIHLNIYAQSSDKPKNSVDEKIKQVENNILPNIYTASDTPTTIAKRMAFYKIKGLSIAVIHNYKMEWAKGYGMADDSSQNPVTVHTLFQAGSISKSLNAVGVLKLVQDKKIDLYADINNYLKSWQFPYDSIAHNKKISTANLLSHTAGLNIHGFGGYRHGIAIPNVVQILEGKTPAYSPRVKSMFAPGLKFQYSGGGVMVSQLVVMDITQQPYDKYMYNNVLKPLGMTSSTYVQPPVNIKADLLATGYRANGSQVGGKYNIYPEQAAAGLWTNPTDLAKYIIEIQLAYQGKSHKILNQQTTQLMLTPYIDKNAALGVFINDWDSVKYFGHDGGDEGFRAIYFGSVDGGNGVVIMANSDNSTILEEVMNSVARVYSFKGMDLSVLKKEAVVADSVLQTYAGEYQLSPGTLTITLEGNRLYGQIKGQHKLEFFPEAQNKFFSKDVNADIEFIKDNEGNVTKAILYENGTHEAKKMK